MSAGEALSGRNVWVGIGKQTAFGVPVAPTKFYEVTAISGILPEYESKKSDRRVGTRFKALGFKTSKKVPLAITVEVNPENAGLLLALGLGSDTVSASGSAHKHTIKIAESLPYFTVWASTAEVADDGADATVHQVVNCKINSIKIDGTVDDVIKLAIEAIGTDRFPALVSKTGISGTGAAESANVSGIASTDGIVPGMAITGTGIPAGTTVLSVASTSLVMSAEATSSFSTFSVAAPVPSNPTASSLFMKAEEGQGKIELGASVGALAQFDESTEFHLSISNGVSADNRIDNTTAAAALREGDSEITGSLKVVYNRNSFEEIKAFQSGDIRALRFTATSSELAATGQPFSLVFSTDRARYSGLPASWDPDVITADAQFEIEKTSGYPIIEIVNADAQAY